MKARILAAVLLAGCVSACELLVINDVKDPIEVSSPQPQTQITKVSLTAAETAMVNAGNELTFNMLPLLRDGGKSFLFSPLSLQYALGMTANGASGETQEEIVRTLGFGDDIAALNALCNKLLNELPAVDLSVKLQLADAILVNDSFPLSPSFKENVESTYYAAVENMSFGDPSAVAARINDWAKRNTNGLIPKMLDAGDISPDAIAFLMNALYFKAPWVQENSDPRFLEENTRKQDFYPGGSDVVQVPTMRTDGTYKYVDMKDFGVLELPYANGSFSMYILLPANRDGFDQLMSDFPNLDWKEIRSRLRSRDVVLNLPKFETSSSYRLNDALKKLGMKRAFTDEAQFDNMFADPGVQALIDFVIQKARISVAEWGTEAAAVTVVGMKEYAMPPGEEPLVEFICDHPFAYLIAENTSGAILFAGAYCGK